MNPRTKKNIFIIAIAILMCLISIYFGMSIWNANNNFLIEHLNQADKLYYYDDDLVPALTFRAAVVTTPFIIGILVLSILGYLQTKIAKVKNLLIGSFIAVGIVIIIDVLTLFNPSVFEFGKWGYVWITMGLIIIWANFLSIFIKEN